MLKHIPVFTVFTDSSMSCYSIEMHWNPFFDPLASLAWHRSSPGCKLRAHCEVHWKRSSFSACALESSGVDSLLSRQLEQANRTVNTRAVQTARLYLILCSLYSVCLCIHLLVDRYLTSTELWAFKLKERRGMIRAAEMSRRARRSRKQWTNKWRFAFMNTECQLRAIPQANGMTKQYDTVIYTRESWGL